MEYHAGKFTLEGPRGQVVQTGPCRVALGDDSLIIAPSSGSEELVFYYSDIDAVVDANQQIELPIYDGRVVLLYFLGTWFGQGLAELRARRGAQLTRNLAMLDAEFAREFHGAYRFSAPDGRHHADSRCRIALYRSSLVVEPEQQDFWNLAYADITEMYFDDQAYSLELRLDLGEQVSFRMLGTRFGELEQEIRRLTAAMYARTAALLKERLPAPPGDSTLEAVARVLRQGQAVPKEAVVQAAPALWPQLEGLLFTGPSGQPDELRRASFAYLASLTAPENVYVGFREVFDGGEPVYWFVVADPQRQRLAVEVTNESGNATYVYRLEGPVPQAVRELSRAMVALNFRRDLIQATEAELASERMARYLVALRKLPHVRRLRELFLGKAAHTTEEAWRRRIGELLG